MESVANFTEFVKAFSVFGAEMVELAHVTCKFFNSLFFFFAFFKTFTTLEICFHILFDCINWQRGQVFFCSFSQAFQDEHVFYKFISKNCIFIWHSLTCDQSKCLSQHSIMTKKIITTLCVSSTKIIISKIPAKKRNQMGLLISFHYEIYK